MIQSRFMTSNCPHSLPLPRPMKVNVASSITMPPTSRASTTIAGEIAFGSTCLKRMRGALAPSDCDASTNSACLRRATVALINRA